MLLMSARNFPLLFARRNSGDKTRLSRVQPSSVGSGIIRGEGAAARSGHLAKELPKKWRRNSISHFWRLKMAFYTIKSFFTQKFGNSIAFSFRCLAGSVIFEKKGRKGERKRKKKKIALGHKASPPSLLLGNYEKSPLREGGVFSSSAGGGHFSTQPSNKMEGGGGTSRQKGRQGPPLLSG